MKENKSGSIINISSVVGEFGNVGQSNYAATKAGVIGLTKSWAKEFSRKGEDIRVNAVAPGYTNTEMMATVPEKVLNSIKEKTMLKRLGEPIEIANAVLFLASSESSYITGQVLSVNGGLRL
ncbi:MAG: SDR family oxidoreductase, partial [Sedimentibacter sp.]